MPTKLALLLLLILQDESGATMQQLIQAPPTEYSLRGSTITAAEHHEYVYASGKLMRETITTTANGTSTTEVLDFIYGSGSTPLALVYTNGTANPVTYYYVTNMQGDVVKLVNASGATVANYTYDAWGKVLSATGSMAEVNPIRYRGYYYDAEVELYYLQSRYYDPAVKRFINADGVTTTGQGFLGANMFAYCLNSPICRIDICGNVSEEAAKDIIEENKEEIIAAGEEYGVDPAIIAGCIYAEQVLNVNWQDALFDLVCFFLDTSIGVGQVKVSTAILVEDAGYIEQSQELVAGWVYVSRNEVVAAKLSDDATNIRYVAAYLKYWQDQWQSTLDISEMPAVLGTLYNLGENANAPNTSPRPNDFGSFVGKVYGTMKTILYGAERRGCKGEYYEIN